MLGIVPSIILRCLVYIHDSAARRVLHLLREGDRGCDSFKEIWGIYIWEYTLETFPRAASYESPGPFASCLHSPRSIPWRGVQAIPVCATIIKGTAMIASVERKVSAGVGPALISVSSGSFVRRETRKKRERDKGKRAGSRRVEQTAPRDSTR